MNFVGHGLTTDRCKRKHIPRRFAGGKKSASYKFTVSSREDASTI